MTNTPPPRNDEPRSPDSETDSADAPVFDDVAAEHPEVQDAAPELIEPEPVAPADVPLAESIQVATPNQDASSDTAETAGYDEHIDEVRPVAEPSVVQPPAAAAPVAEPIATAPTVAAPAAQPVQTIYVAAPVAPKKKGNRGFGLLFALLGTLVFAVLYAAVIALIMLMVRPQNAFGGSVLGFIGNNAFWVPVAVYFVVFALFALLVNRGSWAAWVLSSFLIAVIVYFASIGIILLFEGVLGLSAAEAWGEFGQLALSAPLITTVILAREVTIWFGAAIAARGRKVRERNLEARAAYERELDNQPLGFS